MKDPGLAKDSCIWVSCSRLFLLFFSPGAGVRESSRKESQKRLAVLSVRYVAFEAANSGYLWIDAILYPPRNAEMFRFPL